MNNINILNSGEIVKSKKANAVIGVMFFILATALGAYVRIPIPGSPVPITLQTFFVLLSGAVLGKRLGLCSQLGYIFLGAAGLPLFSAASLGLPYLSGPTGGYLIGFVATSYFVGCMTELKNYNIARIIPIFAFGNLVIIYAFGISWLICLYKISALQAISIGALPFIPGDIVKIFAAAFIYKSISNRTKGIFTN